MYINSIFIENFDEKEAYIYKIIKNMSFTSLIIYSLTAFVSYLYIKYTFFNTKPLLLQKKKDSDINKIPGPISYPFIGTRWIYFWKYKLSQFIDVHIGELIIIKYNI